MTRLMQTLPALFAVMMGMAALIFCWTEWQDAHVVMAHRDMIRTPEALPAMFQLIWVVIALALLVAAYQATRTERGLPPGAALPSYAAAALSSLWLLSQSGGLPVGLNWALLAGATACAWAGAVRAAGAATDLLAGWLTLTLAIATTALVRGVLGFAATDAVWWFLALTLALALAGAWLAARYVTRSASFAGALAWGLVGITANLWWLAQLHVPAVLTATACIIFLRRWVTRRANGALKAA